jgi:hypothetical protein
MGQLEPIHRASLLFGGIMPSLPESDYTPLYMSVIHWLDRTSVDL